MATSHRLGDALEAASRPRSGDGSACLTWGVFHDGVEDANLCGADADAYMAPLDSIRRLTGHTVSEGRSVRSR
jgi:hypothetical protein